MTHKRDLLAARNIKKFAFVENNTAGTVQYKGGG